MLSIAYKGGEAEVLTAIFACAYSFLTSFREAGSEPNGNPDAAGKFSRRRFAAKPLRFRAYCGRKEEIELIGLILSKLEPERTAPGWGDHPWVLVRGQGETVEAVDLVGCRIGERVLVLSGEAGRQLCMGCAADHAVAAVLLDPGKNG